MDYFRDDGKFICLEAPYAEFYIPKYYFENGFADDIGSIIKTLGIMNVGFFDSSGKLLEIRVLNLPTKIDLFISDMEERNVMFEHDDAETPCRVIKYNKGNKIMNNTIVEDSANAEMFVNLINKGKIPSLVPYDKTLSIWNKNMEMNSVNLGVPSVIFELILSAAYRYKKDPTQKFGLAAANDKNINNFDYVMNNLGISKEELLDAEDVDIE